MLREVDVPEVPEYVPTVGAAAVGRRIVQAVRWSLRDTYVTLQDFAAVSAYPLAPAFADWALRLFWLGRGRRAPSAGEAAVAFEERAEPSAADSMEPPPELT